MTKPYVPKVNFTISPAAKAEIENIRQDWNARLPDPAAVAVVAWGTFIPNEAPQFENVVVTFYGESQLPMVADAIQEVSGLKIVFFTTEQHRPRFEGKVLDHSGEQSFFLRDR